MNFHGFWPGSLRVANALEGARHLKHADVVEALADDLEPYGQPTTGVPAIDRRGGLLGHVEGDGEGDVLEGARGFIGRTRKLGGESRHRCSWREHIVVSTAC